MLSLSRRRTSPAPARPHIRRLVGVTGGGHRATLVESSGDLLYRCFMALYWVLLSRTLRSSLVGDLALANALSVPISVAIDAGFSQFLIREFRVGPSSGLPLGLKHAVALRYALIVVSVALASLAIALLGDSPGRMWIGLMIASSYGLDALGQVWLTGSRARLSLVPYFFFRLIESAGVVGGTFALYLIGPYNGVTIAAASFVVYAIAAATAFVQWRRWQWIEGDVDSRPGSRAERRLFGVFAVTTTAYSRLDSVVVQIALGSSGLAVYSLAFKLVEAARVIPGAVARAVLAASSRTGGDRQRRGLPRSVGISFRCAFCMTALLVLGGPWVSSFLFGDRYARASVGIIRVLALTVMIIGFTNPVASLFLAWRRERVAVSNSLWTLLVTVVTTVGLVIPFGLIGVAVGVTIGEVVSFAQFALASRARPTWLGSDAGLVALAAVTVAGCIWLSPFAVGTLFATIGAGILAAATMVSLAHSLDGPQ